MTINRASKNFAKELLTGASVKDVKELFRKHAQLWADETHVGVKDCFKECYNIKKAQEILSAKDRYIENLLKENNELKYKNDESKKVNNIIKANLKFIRSKLEIKSATSNNQEIKVCEKCWSDAFVRSQSDTSKTQTEHYLDLLFERKNHPCNETKEA